MAADISSWRVDSEYIDAFGKPRQIEPGIIEAIERALRPASREGGKDAPRRQVVAFRGAGPHHIPLAELTGPVRWELRGHAKANADGAPVVASGQDSGPSIALPAGLAAGTYLLVLESESDSPPEILVLVTPEAAYQPPYFHEGGRGWLLMVQLYAVRSERNWGHGDFTDVAHLLRIAAEVGAVGIGLNPLHALAPGQASAYSPSSRQFLNALYIDVDAIPEFPGTDACGITDAVARLRTADMLDYMAIHDIKRTALKAAYAAFQADATSERRQNFAAFRHRFKQPLETFALHETLRERFGAPWQSWPPQWHRVSEAATAAAAGSIGDTAFPAFVQWIAHQQLSACTDLAKQLALPVGLYLDVAVGVDADGADAWGAPDALRRDLLIGAPPDVYNPGGQNWGLASLHPQVLIDSDFSSFRQTLRSCMRYAGAIRIDHALGLNRLFLIPAGSTAANGGYVRFPFEAMLAVTAQESTDQRCLVIGEDLGTIPEGVCESLNRWGIWSYRVGLFERQHNDSFRPPEHFPEKAIVTFNTHDLPTFAGWKDSHDLRVKATLGIDAGESEAERQQALNAMRTTLGREGLRADLSLLDVLRYLARTRCQLLAVSIEDIVGLVDQPNIPGTIDEHPNWRRRLPIDIAKFARHETLRGVAEVMEAEGRRRTVR